MSLYVLDTDTLTLYRRNHPTLKPRVDAKTVAELAITVMTVEERLSGWYTRIRQAKTPQALAVAYQQLADAVQFLGKWNLLSFTEPAIDRFKRIKALRLNVGSMDLSIAAITLEHGGTLVTRNVRDFQRVPGLTIEDWSV